MGLSFLPASRSGDSTLTDEFGSESGFLKPFAHRIKISLTLFNALSPLIAFAHCAVPFSYGYNRIVEVLPVQ